MQLEESIRHELARPEKDILLMTHIVLGYPSLEVNRQVISQMVANGVELIEMQIPFSEPMADGPTIVRANQEALAAGTTVAACLEFAEEMCRTHKTSFLFMTYYNILYKFGMEAFLRRRAKSASRVLSSRICRPRRVRISGGWLRSMTLPPS